MNETIALELVNAALVTAGENTIASFTEETTLASTANLIYEMVVSTMLNDDGLRWAQKYETLDYDGDESPTRFGYTYDKPSDMLSLRSVMVSNEEVPFDTYDDKITVDYGSSSTVQAFYTYRADESVWPGDFRFAVTLRLQAEFLKSFEKFNEAAGIAAEAEFQLRRARTNASKGRGSRDPWRSRLVTARRTS